MTFLSTNQLLLTILAIANVVDGGPLQQCLDGCTCEEDNNDKVIRCDSMGLEKFPFPYSTPLKGYQFLALTCNQLSTIPSISLIKASFPDLQGIDVQGNRLLNCTDLEFLHREIPVLSDCSSESPLQCENIDENCDWKCRSLEKLRRMWEDFKRFIDKQSRQIGADKVIKRMKNWFARQFEALNSKFDMWDR